MIPRSYEKIHYGLRPAKNVQRKMMCEVFRKLSVFGKVEFYRYIGFGSTYFSDFILFHKSLGTTNMVSIERDVEHRERFEFNRPYGCIRIEFAESNEVLPSLEWNARTILWLDYDVRLDASVLTDVHFFCAFAAPGSVIAVTVDARPDKIPDEVPAEERDTHRLLGLKDRVGEEKVPPTVNGADLAGWGSANVSRTIITNEISETLNERNGGLEPGSQLLYEQLFNFQYDDGTKMLTVGGLLYDEGQTEHVARCKFESIPFVRSNQEAYLIEIPNLTYKEIRHLDRQLPVDDPADLEGPGIPPEDLEKYAGLYRYFPTFAEAEV